MQSFGSYAFAWPTTFSNASLTAYRLQTTYCCNSYSAINAHFVCVHLSGVNQQ